MAKLQQILSLHAIEPSKTWGTSEKWVLELKDGRQVVVPIEIKSPLIDSALVSNVDVEQKEGFKLYKVILNGIRCLWRSLFFRRHWWFG